MRVAIVGGGVGGLTAAIALRRKGFAVEVYEQAPELERVGASLQLGPNALRLMDELGLLDALRRIGVLPKAVELVRWDDGSLLLRTPVGREIEAELGAPQLDFLRPDLHAALARALPPGTLRLGQWVAAVQQDGDGVSLQLSGGGRVLADVAVAADGVRSPIRQQLFGAEDPAFSGTVVYRGVAPRDRVADLHPDHVNRYWLGPSRHGVSYWISAGELLAVNCAVQDAEWSRESWTLETGADEVEAAFRGWDEPLLQRIRACRRFLRGAVFVRRPLAGWSEGRITLLGDAAHAMEPFQAQGAAQAVEDAYVLAECLDGGRGDIPGALARYGQIRMSRAEEIQDSSRAAALEYYLPDGPEQQARDARYARLPELQPWGPRQPIWEYDVRDAVSQR